jgi:hypothetical protein
VLYSERLTELHVECWVGAKASDEGVDKRPENVLENV